MEDKEPTYAGKWDEETTVTEVTDGDTHYSIGTGGMGFGLAKSYGVKPSVGDKIQVNTVAFAIRGVRVNGEQVFLKSEEEAEAEHAKWVEENNAQKRAEFEKNREELDKTFALLPEVFQRRITRLRGRNPDFRWEYEPYDLMCCTDAVFIANWAKTPERVIEFQKMDHKEQFELVPDLDDGHSGNSFGFCIQLAYVYLTKPGAVPFMHGALAPLVGCEGYNCHPLTAEEEKEVAALKLEDLKDEAQTTV